MCRLVAYVGDPRPVGRFLFGGGHALARQAYAPRELLTGSVNVDGFGVGWQPASGGALVRLARVEPPWHDPDLPGLLESIPSGRVLAALRNATPGLPVSATGLLPYIDGAWAGALNGYVPQFRARHMRALRAALDDDHYGRLTGSSDAETLFLLAVQSLRGGSDPGSALVEVARRLGTLLAPDERAPVTVVLTGPPGITVLHTALLGSRFQGAVNSLYLSRGWEPGGVVVASEPLDDHGGWERLPDHTLLHVEPDGTTTIDPL